MTNRKRDGWAKRGVSRRQVLQGLAAAAATTAVAGSRVVSGAAPAARSGSIVLQYQTANLTEAQYEPVWKAIIAKFEAQNPTIKVEPILVARKDHWTKFVTASKANQAPDVVSVDIATAAYNGYLRPLDDLWQAEPASYRQAWTADAIKTASWQGKFYGLPSWGGIYGEIYNRDLVKQAGLDLSKPPATWSEYLDWSKRLTREGQQWALAILAGKTDSTTRMLLMWIWSNGGEAFNADMTQATFAGNPKSLEALEFYLNLDLVHKVVAPGAASINYLEQTTLFAQQKIASMRNAYWGVAKVVGDNPAITNKIAVAFPPMNADKKVTLATMAADSISKDCKHVEAAWKFVKFVNDREWGIKRALVSNWMPMRTDLAADPEVKKDPMLVQFLEYGKVARAYPLPHPLWADIAANDIVAATQSALLKRMSVKDAFAKLDAELNKKFQEM
jgi:ABC-type glycerol-3-phosphate transport system substrate-binding protein